MSEVSDLSDAEIAERTARDVMGWVKDDIGEGRYWKPLETDEGHTIGVSNVGYEPPWDPVNDANHRERLKKHAINEYGLTVTTWQDPTGQGAEVMPYDETLGCGDPTRKLVIRSGGRAVIEAILDAVQEIDDA